MALWGQQGCNTCRIVQAVEGLKLVDLTNKLRSSMSLRYELQKQKQVKKMRKNIKQVGQNMVMDRILMGASAFVLMALAVKGLLPLIKATEPVNYLLAVGFLSTIMYLILAPFFRK